MSLPASTALPYNDAERAAAGLRGQLRLRALDGGLVPLWTTLTISDATPSPDALGRAWFEWSATLETKPAPESA